MISDLPKGIYHQFSALTVRMLHRHDAATIVTTRTFHQGVVYSIDVGISTISLWKSHVCSISVSRIPKVPQPSGIPLNAALIAASSRCIAAMES